MYYGYCFTAVDGWHTPKVQLPTAEDTLAYCKLQHNLFPEVRITNEDDFCVLQVVNHIMYCPIEEGIFRAVNLLNGEVRELTIIDPLLLKGEPQVSEEPKPTKINGVSPMPIIDFSEFDLDNIPELKILPAGSEVKLRILDVNLKPDKNNDLMMQLRLDIVDEPLAKEVYWQCHLPKRSMGEKRVNMLKEFLSQFCEAFEIDKTSSNDTSNWLGKEGWAILGVRTDARYGDSNEINRWLKEQ